MKIEKHPAVPCTQSQEQHRYTNGKYELQVYLICVFGNIKRQR